MARRLLVVLAVLLPLFASAQEYRGAISGAVTDRSGAVIPGAKVTVTEIQTGTKVTTETESTGHYTAPFLLPGDYEIAVQASGFKSFLRRGVHVGSGERPVIDVQLEVGEVSESVVVRADAPLLNSDNGSVGQTITTKEVEDLPSNGGTPMMLAALALGVLATSQPNAVLPFASGGGASWSIAGNPSQTNELLIDGSPNGTWDGRLAYSGLKDAVQEVRIKTFETDAAYGHTGSGTINQILKSGTNAVHGSAYWYHQPTNTVANNFFSNKTGLPVTINHFNQYGGTAGGPVVIPKVFDGRNKLFWFFGAERIQNTTPTTTFFSVPTDAERRGDFSQLLTLTGANRVVLYDPATGVRSGNTVTRSPFPNNVIPTARLNQIALNYLQYYPIPNITDPSIARADGFQNYGSNAPSFDGYTNQLGRLDWNINSRNRSYFNVRHTDYFQTRSDFFSNIATGSFLSRSNWGLALDHVFTVNATNVINVRANFSRMFEDHKAPSAGFDPASLGFPSYLGSNSQYAQLPYITFATNTAFQALGTNGANILPSQSLQLFGNWVAIRGKHQLKFGGDVRQYRFNFSNFLSSTGNFQFTANTWTRSASNASTTVAMGQDFSQFLLGLPTGGTYDLPASSMFYQYYAAGFVQDDWRVKRNLTINLGLRFDHDYPWREKWARTVNGFAFDATNPLSAAATAAYARAPLPLLPANDFRVLGGLTFASPKDNAIFKNTSHLFSPRFGFAWTPDRLPRTVIRGGLAMFVSSISLYTLQVSGAYSTNPILAQHGFSQSTALTATNDNGLTPAATLNNPFPNGITRPAGSANGLLTFAGQAVNFFNPEMKSPYSVRWNFGFQHELPSNTVLEVVYTGNHAVHLPVTYTQLNGIPRQFLSTSQTRDQAVINTLTGTVANPFLGLQTSAGTAATVAAVQLLAKYPQFPVGFSTGAFGGSTGVVENDLNVGSSYFHSLGVGLQKRLSHGLSIRGNYMRSKMIERVTWLNSSDAQPEKRISPFDRPHRIVAAVTYELPFGRGKKVDLQSNWARLLFGGWTLTSVYQRQVGAPMTWVNGSTNNPGDYVYFGAPLKLNNREATTTAFDVTAFDRNAANQFQYHIRTFATTFPNLRVDGINQWDVSVLKKIQITEYTRVELRGEAFNVVNHPVFGAPNTTATNSAFGTISTQANRPRLLQLALRVIF